MLKVGRLRRQGEKKEEKVEGEEEKRREEKKKGKSETLEEKEVKYFLSCSLVEGFRRVKGGRVSLTVIPGRTVFFDIFAVKK